MEKFLFGIFLSATRRRYIPAHRRHRVRPSVNIVDKRFVTKIYDKRDDFDFDIVNYPDLSGNIPRRQAYGVYTSQILRYAKVCSEREDYEKCLRTLTGKLIRKGFRKNELENTLSRCYHKYPWIVKKYKL